MQEKRNRVVCFSTTESMVAALKELAPSKDSLSALLREIINQYLTKIQNQTNTPSQQ